MQTITIDGVNYDVPAAVAEYVNDRQAATRNAEIIGMKLVERGAYAKSVRFADMTREKQLAYVMQILVDSAKQKLAVLQVATEIAALYKAERERDKAAQPVHEQPELTGLA